MLKLLVKTHVVGTLIAIAFCARIAAAGTYTIPATVAVSSGPSPSSLEAVGTPVTVVFQITSTKPTKNQESQVIGDASYSLSYQVFSKSTQDGTYAAVTAGDVTTSSSSGDTLTVTMNTGAAAAYYKITATGSVSYGDNLGNSWSSGTKSKDATVTLVAVDKIVVNQSSPEDGGPVYCYLGDSVVLKAKAAPTDQTFPSGKPTWQVSSKPSDSSLTDPSSGLTPTVTPDKVGQYTIKATCGTSNTTFTIIAFTLKLITPNGDPVASPNDAGDGQNEFTFSTDASAGSLAVSIVAIPNPANIDLAKVKDKVSFTSSTIGDSLFAWAWGNEDGKAKVSGGINSLYAVAQFLHLPSANSAFGMKTAALTYSGSEKDSKHFEVFYPKSASNHPGGQAGSPNWYFYWSMTSANKATGTVKYVSATPPRSNYYVITNIISIEDDAATSQIAAWGTPKGIDCFAWTTAHENKHYTQAKGFWPTGWIAADDLDSDGLPDAIEGTYMPGRPYDPSVPATYPDTIGYGSTGNLNDVEDICMRSQTAPYGLDQLWTNGSADTEDWAQPGKNSKTKY